MKRILIVLLALATLSACRRAPVIGISSGRSESGAATLSANYTDAVVRAGGVPVIFPTVADSALASTLIRMVDGVIFSGGPDLDPSYYGETVWNETVEVDTLRDVSDLLLMRAALASGKPVMAICRGEQLMNVVLGGSLVQDIPTQVDTMVRHSGGVRHRDRRGEGECAVCAVRAGFIDRQFLPSPGRESARSGCPGDGPCR
jgi:Predicted glutamine amidotransferases